MDQEYDYEVGYGKPPRESQFRKGSSGNPNGRPKASSSPDEHLMRELNKQVTVTEDGERKRITKSEALMKQLLHKALSGEPAAQRLISRHIERLQSRYDAIAVAQSIEQRKVSVEDLTDEELTAFIRAGNKKTKSGDPDHEV